MDRLGNLSAFVRTAELGSFVAAGRILAVSPSAVGKSVTRLEGDLGVRLFQRSTRNLHLTEEGRMFYERCRRILDDLHDAEALVSRSRAVPRGRLRLSTPIITYHLLLPVLPEFIACHPEVEIDIDFNDRLVDLIEDGVDVAIRSGTPPDSGLKSRLLRPFRLQLCAAPGYLDRHGRPETPRDLDRHLALRFRLPDTGKLQEWPLVLKAGVAVPAPRTALTCNNMEALRGAAIAGLGIGCMPDFLAEGPIASGTLSAVLQDHVAGPGQFRLLWPSSRHLSPRVRALVDFLGDRLSRAPDRGGNLAGVAARARAGRVRPRT